MTNRNWDLAGMTDPNRGGLERTLTARRWRRPARVWLDGEKLLWSDDEGDAAVAVAGEDLLGGFVALAKGSPFQILDFANRWGPLELCEDNAPRYHPWPYWPTLPPDQLQVGGFCDVRLVELGQYWEPVAAWIAWARKARGILDVAAALHQGRTVETKDWVQALGPALMPTFVWEEGWKRSLGIDPTRTVEPLVKDNPWEVLVVLLNHWLQLTPVGPELHWRDKRMTLELGGGGLFGALAIRLVLAVSRIEGLAICDACKKPYIPRRQPRANQRHYCEDCRPKVALRDAQRDRRERMAQAQKLHEEGLSVQEIGQKLDTKASTIKRWVGTTKTRTGSHITQL